MAICWPAGTGGGEDACRGDSGGPLVAAAPAHPMQENVATLDEATSDELQIELLNGEEVKAALKSASWVRM